MFQTATIAGWLFGMFYAASMGLFLFSLERISTQVNLVDSPEKKVNWYPPKVSTHRQLFSKSHVLGHYLEIISRYREFYPSSTLPEIVGFAFGGCIVGFIGVVMSVAIN